MKNKNLAIILVILLGGMAIYYNYSTSDTAKAENATNAEKANNLK